MSPAAFGKITKTRFARFDFEPILIIECLSTVTEGFDTELRNSKKRLLTGLCGQ